MNLFIRLSSVSILYILARLTYVKLIRHQTSTNQSGRTSYCCHVSFHPRTSPSTTQHIRASVSQVYISTGASTQNGDSFQMTITFLKNSLLIDKIFTRIYIIIYIAVKNRYIFYCYQKSIHINFI